MVNRWVNSTFHLRYLQMMVGNLAGPNVYIGNIENIYNLINSNIEISDSFDGSTSYRLNLSKNK